MTATTDPTPEWLDVQYDNRARVPEAASILQRWTKASALARERALCHLDLPYGPDASERLDVFTTSQPKAPVMVFIHGGWWRSLDKSDHSFVAPAFTRAGALVVVPNYALCPGASIAQIALQMTRALAWVYANAARYGGDPERIVIAGHSAGGHLAAMLLCCRWPEVEPGLPNSLVRSALGISGLYDLEAIRRTPKLQADLRLTPEDAARLSPSRFTRPDAGRLWALVGGDESEEFLRQNSLIRSQWGADVVPVCETVPGRHHFDVMHTFVDPQARLHRLTLALLGLPPTLYVVPTETAELA